MVRAASTLLRGRVAVSAWAPRQTERYLYRRGFWRREVLVPWPQSSLEYEAGDSGTSVTPAAGWTWDGCVGRWRARWPRWSWSPVARAVGIPTQTRARPVRRRRLARLLRRR